MKKVPRQEHAIYEYLTLNGKMSLAEAMGLLGVSESTVRRLFIGLERSGRALRVHGGVQLIADQPFEYSFEQFESRQANQKQAIAACAVDLVEDGDILYVDSGTTLARFSERLSHRLEAERMDNVTVVTNSLVNLTLLQRHRRLLMVGGEFRGHRKDFCGYMAEEMLKPLAFTKCFLGSDGFNPESGFATTDFQTARLNEIVLNNAGKAFVLMDSSKFGAAAIISFTKKRRIDALFTDCCPDGYLADALEQLGTQVILCDPERDFDNGIT